VGCNNYYSSASTDKYIETDAASRLAFDNAGNMTFYVAPAGTADAAISWTTAMTIGNNGDVDIGNLSTSGTTAGVKFRNSGNEYELRTSLNTTNGRSVMTMYNPNGEVGKIYVAGSSTSYNTSSDYRLKENVVPMTGSIDRLKELNPSRFNFIADADKTVDGFLAHEAAVVVPECTTGTKDAMRDEEYEVTPAVMDGETVVTEAVMGTRSVPDYQGIDQSKLVPLLVASLQEAVAKIEALEARVTALEPTI
jgi:hypothetical protein